MPVAIYDGAPETSTIGIPSLLLAAPHASEDAVEALVDVLIERPSDLIPVGTSGIQFLDNQSLINTYGVPLQSRGYRRQHGGDPARLDLVCDSTTL